MTKLSFEFAGLTFLEPMAFILNWVIMLQAWIYFTKLKKWRLSSFSINWRWFFLLFGFAGLFGGLSHLLFTYTGLPGKSPGWTAGIFAISFMELAMVSLSENRLKSFFQVFVTIKLLITMIVLSITMDFTVVIIHSSGMAVFLLVPSIIYMSKGKRELNYFFLGALSLMATLPFKLLAIDFHVWFNRDDISHVFMIMASVCFYRGVKEYESKTLPIPITA